MVLLTDILTSMRVKVPLNATTKSEVLREMVDVLAQEDCIRDREAVLRVVEQREQVLSTGIGHGVALPHGKTDMCSDLAIAAGVTREPVPFEALDSEPVRLVFLLVAPEAPAGSHIRALKQISQLVREPELRERLTNAPDADSFLQALRDAEAA